MTTFQTITNFMLKDEKIINWYNKKYSFDMSKATAKEHKEYQARLASWDMWKAKRNQLKQAA